jgi:hypothetical protein
MRHWQNYTNQHLKNKNINLAKREWASKLIGALWVHLRRVWNFAENRGQISRYKLEAQSRAMTATWEIHQELQGRLKTFQHQHFDGHEQVEKLHYDIKQCWMGLAQLFLDEIESVTPIENTPLAAFLTRRAGIG